MPTKRAILSELTRDELRSNLDYYGLDVRDRRVRSELVDALAGSRRARLDEMLGALSRDRLKALCRAFDLDDAGRRKADLVGRLVGPVRAANTARGGATAVAAATPAPAAETADPPAETLGVEQLERYLWSAADILRGSIDSSDYKTYIFGLLFLKRLSDRFEEEAEKLVAEGVSAEVAWTDPDEHQFFVPRRARWSTIQKKAANIGEALNKACAALEEQNPALEGVLAGIDYNDERKLGDARNRDNVLARLVLHFSQVWLRNDRMAEPDLLGRAYEYLIEQFADDAGKKGGEFYTPRMVVKLIVELLAPTERMRICDPTAGSGGMLIECAHHIERQGGNPRNLTLHGQEKNLSTWAICKMNMLLHGLPDARIEKGDTIRDPKLVDEGELLLYDRVIANPPFSLDEWGREVAESDGFGRFRFRRAAQDQGHLAFVQHMVAVLNEPGRLGVVMPHGVLFRGDQVPARPLDHPRRERLDAAQQLKLLSTLNASRTPPIRCPSSWSATCCSPASTRLSNRCSERRERPLSRAALPPEGPSARCDRNRRRETAGRLAPRGRAARPRSRRIGSAKPSSPGSGATPPTACRSASPRGTRGPASRCPAWSSRTSRSAGEAATAAARSA